jgi:hypothetical protein
MLRPTEWFKGPPQPVVRVVRLQVVASAPCATCPERIEPGAERRRLSLQLRLLKRRDFERPLRGPCAQPCAELEAQLDPANPCRGCFHREAKTCRTACHVLEKLLPRATPTYYDEVPVKEAVIEVRAPEPEEPVPDAVRWRWADLADELRPRLQRAIQERLTSQQQRAVELHLSGLNGVETARAMGVSKVTVHWLVKRAKTRIAAFFEELAAKREPA